MNHDDHQIAHQMVLDLFKRVKFYADHINSKNEYRIDYLFSISVSKDGECLEGHNLMDADYDSAEILLKEMEIINQHSLGLTMKDLVDRYKKDDVNE